MSGRMSAKTGFAPRRAKALAVETKVNDGTITSSPGLRSSSRAAISRAWVQLVVSSALAAAEHLAQQGVAALRVVAVAGDPAPRHGVLHIGHLVADHRRLL